MRQDDLCLNYETARVAYLALTKLGRAFARAKIQSIEVQGIKSCYLEAGQNKAQALVFLHGFNDSMDSFTMVAAKLRQLGSQHKMILLDLPGSALQLGPKHFDYSFAGFARWLSDVLQKMDLHNVCLIGNSLGGGVALEYVQNFNQTGRVKSLALINSSNIVALDGPSFYSHYFAGKNLFHLTSYDEFVYFRQQLFLKPIHVPDIISQLKYREYQRNLAWNMQLIDQLFQSHSNVNANNWREYGRIHNEKLREIAVPVLAIWGECDFLFPPEIVDVLRQNITDLAAHVYPQVGHCPQLEYPASVARDLLFFLNKYR